MLIKISAESIPIRSRHTTKMPESSLSPKTTKIEPDSHPDSDTLAVETAVAVLQMSSASLKGRLATDKQGLVPTDITLSAFSRRLQIGAADITSNVESLEEKIMYLVSVRRLAGENGACMSLKIEDKAKMDVRIARAIEHAEELIEEAQELLVAQNDIFVKLQPYVNVTAEEAQG